MKRHGLLAAGILGSATAVCLLLNRYNALSASEEEARSFRQALAGTETSEVDDVEGGFRINYYDATWNRVLQDLAKHNELTLVMDKVPPGRFAGKTNATTMWTTPFASSTANWSRRAIGCCGKNSFWWF